MDLLVPQENRVDRVKGVNEEPLDHRVHRDNQVTKVHQACQENQERREHLVRVEQMEPLALGENVVHRENVGLKALLVRLEILVKLVFLVLMAKLVREVFLAPLVPRELLVLQDCQECREHKVLLALKDPREIKE